MIKTDDFSGLNINDLLTPGTKFITYDNKTYIFIGYALDINNLICIDENNKYNGKKNQILRINDIQKITYIPQYEQQKLRFIYQ